MDWPQLIHELGLGHPLKFLWEEKAQTLTTYSNFWEQFYRKFPQYRQAAVIARDFEPGERIEVDYAGDTLEWVELSTGEIHKAYVFVAGLGFSQLLFAWAPRTRAATTASAAIEGCSSSTVASRTSPCLTASSRAFSSATSRRERFESVEKAALKALPTTQFDVGEWKTVKLHPDCYILVDKAYYSAPHIHRGRQLRVKLTEQHVEIFLDLERLALHPRCRSHDGRRIRIDAHFPPASQAYYEATPQKLLSQSQFIHP